MIAPARAALFALAFATPAAAQDSIAEDPAATATHAAADPLAQAHAAAARGDEADALAHYLRALTINPRNLDALTGAGRTALDLDDPESAIAFFARAEEVAPRDGRVKAGLGEVMVARRNPVAALRFFREAVALGVPVADVAAARGLAYDLRGDGRRAQADYHAALAAHDDPETVRRLALSQAMTGQRETALATLDPLLRRQDIPAWRARAFVYAVTGAPDEAEKAARQVMPRAQADALSPYLTRIAGLRPAAQAAAVHLGYLPPGPPAPRPAQSASTAAIRPAPAAADTPGPAATVWSRAPARFGPTPIAGETKPRPPAPTAAAPATSPAGGTFAATATIPPGAAPAPLPADPPVAGPALAAGSATLPAVVSRPAAPADGAPDRPGQSATPQASPPSPRAVAPNGGALVDVPAGGSAVADGDRPAPAARPAAAMDSAAGRARPGARAAGDETVSSAPAGRSARATRRETAAADTKAAKPAKTRPAAPREPERHWVQVAGGANVADMPKAWAGLLKAHGATLRGRQPFTMHYRFTNRLMVGPFADGDAAQAFVNRARKDGLPGFAVTSRAGEAVEKMATR